MTEINRQEFNIMVARLTAVERMSDRYEERLDQIDTHLVNTDKYVWDEFKDLRKTLQDQGLRLALIFGGISVVVTGIGLIIGITTLIKQIKGG